MIELMLRNIIYLQQIWNEQDTLDVLLPDLPNYFRAINDGFKLPDLVPPSAELLTSLLPLLERHGFTHAWLGLVETALGYKAVLNLDIVARLYAMAGVLTRLQRELPLALEYQHTALNYAYRAENASIIARSHYYLSGTLRDMRDYEAATIHAEKALALWHESDTVWAAAALNTLGLISYVQGHYEPAEAWYRRALALGDTLPKYTIEAARYRYNLALCLQAQSHWQAAHDFYEAAATFLIPSLHVLDWTRLTFSHASLFYQIQQYEQAEAVYRQIPLSVLRQTGFSYYEGIYAQSMGNVLLALKRYSEAHEYLVGAIQIWETLADPVMLANSIGTRGEINAAQGKKEMAQTDLRRAVELLLPFIERDGNAKAALSIFEAVLASLNDFE